MSCRRVMAGSVRGARHGDRQRSVRVASRCSACRAVRGPRARVRRGGAPDPPASRRARELLGWLALHPGRHARAAVAARFWPDVLDASARASLRTTLHELRRALGPAGDCLVADRDAVALERGGSTRARLDALLAAAPPRRRSRSATARLLAGLEEDWVLAARDDVPRAPGGAARGARRRGRGGGRRRRGPPPEPRARRRSTRSPRSAGGRLSAASRPRATAPPRSPPTSACASGCARTSGSRRRPRRGRSPRRSGRPSSGLAPASPRSRPPPGVPRSSAAPAARSSAATPRSPGSRPRSTARGPASAASSSSAASRGSARPASWPSSARAAPAGGATVRSGRCFEEAIAPVPAVRRGARRRVAPRRAAPRATTPAARAGASSSPSTPRCCAGAPPVLALDDLHWADRGSLLLLAHLVRARAPRRAARRRHLPRERALAHASARATLGDLRREGLYERVSLAGLDRAAVAALVRGWLGSDDRGRTLHDETGGQPVLPR